MSNLSNNVAYASVRKLFLNIGISKEDGDKLFDGLNYKYDELNLVYDFPWSGKDAEEAIWRLFEFNYLDNRDKDDIDQGGFEELSVSRL
jgi:hypothetical protein